jgi:hypothetical protein
VVGRGVVSVGEAAPHFRERMSMARRRMVTGYGMQTWCNRVDELGGELWRYMEAGDLPQKEALKVSELLRQAAEIIRRRDQIRTGVKPSGKA